MATRGRPSPPPLLPVWPDCQGVGGNWSTACRGRPTGGHSRSRPNTQRSCTCWPGPSFLGPYERWRVQRGSWPSKDHRQGRPQHKWQGEEERGPGWSWTPRTPRAGAGTDNTMEGALHLLSGLCNKSQGRCAGPKEPTPCHPRDLGTLVPLRPTQSHLLQAAFSLSGGPSPHPYI